MAVTNEKLYIKFDQNIEVRNPDVYFRDVAKMECANQAVVNKLNATKILKIPSEKNSRYVFSVLKIIEMIHQIYPQLDVNNVGEPDFIITYEKKRNHSKMLRFAKIVLVCVTTFLGSAFAIMAFNNDASVTKLFGQMYEQFTGQKASGFTIMEFSYSIGLIFGILIFFNHFGGRKITVDPTPLEVEMRLYEDDVNTTLIEAYTRKESSVDVGDKGFPGDPRG